MTAQPDRAGLEQQGLPGWGTGQKAVRTMGYQVDGELCPWPSSQNAGQEAAEALARFISDGNLLPIFCLERDQWLHNCGILQNNPLSQTPSPSVTVRFLQLVFPWITNPLKCNAC